VGDPDDRDEGVDRRRFERVLVDLEVDYSHQDTYLFAYIRDISATGLFVRTNEPEPPGTRMNVRFTPPDEDPSGPLELEAEVIWVNKFRPERSDSIHPGMGIRFVDLSGDDRERLIDYVKRFAYLDDGDDEI
jgi:type IV pilus assembly protein PilZ